MGNVLIAVRKFRAYFKEAGNVKYPLIAAFLIILSFPKFYLWPLAYFFLIPIFILFEKEADLRKITLYSFLFFFIWYLYAHYGFIYYSLFWYLIIVFLLSFLGTFFLLISYIMWAKSLALKNIFRYFFLLFAVPSVWGMYEIVKVYVPYIQTTAGSLIAYSQALNYPFLQFASLIGGLGISWIIVAVNVTLYFLIYERSARGKAFPFAVLLLFFLSLFAGYLKYAESFKRIPLQVIKAGVIQPCVGLEEFNNAEKYNLNDGYEVDTVTEKLFRMISGFKGKSIDILFLPERVFPDDLTGSERGENTERLTDLIRELHTPVFMGALHYVSEYEQYNSAYLVNECGEVVKRYDKLILYPIAEYIPGGRKIEELFNKEKIYEIFPFSILFDADSVNPDDGKFHLDDFLGTDILSPGKRYILFELKGIYFSSLICLEDMLPFLAEKFVKKGARFLVVLINEAWFRKAASVKYHLFASVFRAVENGVPLLRVTNTADSVLILPNGKISSICKDRGGKSLLSECSMVVEIPVYGSTPSFFTRFGYIVPLAISVLFIFSFFVLFLL